VSGAASSVRVGDDARAACPARSASAPCRNTHVARIRWIGGGSREPREAIAASDAYLASLQSGYSDTWILLRAQLASRIVLGAHGGESSSEWVWAVWYVSPDGYFENTVYVGYLNGLARQSSGGNVRFP
jgi:hypothetical protein